jgi:hypothetical protein
MSKKIITLLSLSMISQNLKPADYNKSIKIASGCIAIAALTYGAYKIGTIAGSNRVATLPVAAHHRQTALSYRNRHK